MSDGNDNPVVEHSNGSSNLFCHTVILMKLSLFFTFLNAETITKVNGTSVEPITSPSLHDLQVYGIVVTIALCFIVFGGVKMINRVAPAFLVPVLFSLFSILVGIFLARKDYPEGVHSLLATFIHFSFSLSFFFFLIRSMKISLSQQECTSHVRDKE